MGPGEEPTVLCFQQRSVKLECQGPGKLEGPEPSEILVAPEQEEEVEGEGRRETLRVLPALVVSVLRLPDPIRVSRRVQAFGDGAA